MHDGVAMCGAFCVEAGDRSASRPGVFLVHGAFGLNDVILATLLAA